MFLQRNIAFSDQTVKPLMLKKQGTKTRRNLTKLFRGVILCTEGPDIGFSGSMLFFRRKKNGC
jgi:hypothetical protein